MTPVSHLSRHALYCYFWHQGRKRRDAKSELLSNGSSETTFLLFLIPILYTISKCFTSKVTKLQLTEKMPFSRSLSMQYFTSWCCLISMEFLTRNPSKHPRHVSLFARQKHADYVSWSFTRIKRRCHKRRKPCKSYSTQIPQSDMKIEEVSFEYWQ